MFRLQPIAVAVVLLLQPGSVACASGPPTPLKLTPFGLKQTLSGGHHNNRKVDLANQPTFIVRGGSDKESSEDEDVSLVSISNASDVFVQLFGVINAFHGTILALIPSIGRELLGSDIEEDDEVAAYAEEAAGCFALEYGLTGYLAATGITSPEMAIGYGTLPDVYFMSKNLLNGKFESMGVQKLMIVLTTISAAGTAAILADKLHLGPIIEVLALVPAIQGAMKYFDPIGSGKKMMGADLSENSVAKALYRTSGQMKLVSAILRGSIAFGVKPLRALAYSSFAGAALILDSVLIRKSQDDVKNDMAIFHQLGSLGLTLGMGIVFFLNSK